MNHQPKQKQASPAEFDDTGAGAEPGAAPWFSVIRITAADWSIAAGDLACLLERNLIERTGRALGLDKGRVVLGLTV